MSLAYREAKHAFERTYVTALMESAQGNIAEAARISGLPRSQIYRLIERAGELRPLRAVGESSD
jgi:two-component system response regulator AtoC